MRVNVVCSKGRDIDGKAAGKDDCGTTKAHDDPDREPKAAAQMILLAPGARPRGYFEVVILIIEYMDV